MMWLKPTARRRSLLRAQMAFNASQEVRYVTNVVGKAACSRPLVSLMLFVLFSCTRANPTDYFPINSQLPPVARVDVEFSFVFSLSTFSSDYPMTYTLEDSPTWLSIESEERRIYGTPTEDDLQEYGDDLDVIGIPINIVATDKTGSTSSQATLVVSRNHEPEVVLPLSQQIEGLGDAYSAPSSLLFLPTTDFSFEFSPDTFLADGYDTGSEGLAYYAVSDDWTPLPSWIRFDPRTLTFSGTTPPFESLVQPPQRFGLRLVASDVTGFSGTDLGFTLVVGVHELTSDLPVIQVNATRGEELVYNELPDLLKVDGNPLQSKDVSSIAADGLPAWLDFNEKTWALTGTPGHDEEPANVTVSVEDVYLDQLNVTLVITFDDTIFISDPPAQLNATAGDDVSLGISENLLNPDDVVIVIESEPEASWLQFDDRTKTLTGSVPEEMSEDFASTIKVSFEASLEAEKGGMNKSEIKTMSLVISTPTPTPEPTETPHEDKPLDDSNRNLLWLLLPAMLLISVGLILLLFWVRHRRRMEARNYDVSDVSAPLPGSFVTNPKGSPGARSSASDVRKMLDSGPFVPGSGGHVLAQPRRSSNLRSSYKLYDPAYEGSVPEGTALATTPQGAPQLPQELPKLVGGFSVPRVVVGRPVSESGRASASPHSQVSGESGASGNGGIEEQSLWSDTSIEGSSHGHLATMVPVSMIGRRKTDMRDTFRDSRLGLDNLTAEHLRSPNSIQPTPDLAYQRPLTLDQGPEEEVRQPDEGQGLGLRPPTVASAGHSFKADGRISNISAVSDTPTTRTSLLTSGLGLDYYTKNHSHRNPTPSTASHTNMLARPTIVHIPSRPGESRQPSRQSSQSTTAPSPLFGRGSPPKIEQRNTPNHNTPNNNFFGLMDGNNTHHMSVAAIHEVDAEDEAMMDDLPEPPPLGTTTRDPATTSSATAGARDSDSSWDRFARDSLGIAYKDLLQAPEMLPLPDTAPTPPPGTANTTTAKRTSVPGNNGRASFQRWSNYGNLRADDSDNNINLHGIVFDEEEDEDQDEECNWKLHHHTSQDLMSPDQWPQPFHHNNRASRIGVALAPNEDWNRTKPSPSLGRASQDLGAENSSKRAGGPPVAFLSAQHQRFRESRSTPSNMSMSLMTSSTKTQPTGADKTNNDNSSGILTSSHNGGNVLQPTGRNSRSTTASAAPKKSRSTASRDERLRISQLREQRALEQFQALMAGRRGSDEENRQPSGSSGEGGEGPRRPLPETPQPAASQLRVVSGNAGRRSGGLEGTNRGSSRKLLQSLGSGRGRSSNRMTMRSEWTDLEVEDDDDDDDVDVFVAEGDEVEDEDEGVGIYEDGDGDDDDAWEDVRRPESAYLGRWDYEGSDGSFAVYI